MTDAEILLRVRRQYSESEAVKAVEVELRKANFKIGELVSEVSELTDKNNAQQKKIAELKKGLQEMSKELAKTKEQLRDKIPVMYARNMRSSFVEKRKNQNQK